MSDRVLGNGGAKGPVRVVAPELPAMTTLLTLAVAVVVVAALYFARSVLIPVTLAVLLSFVLAPLANFLRRFLPRPAAVLLSVVLALGIIGSAASLIGTQIASLVPQLSTYEVIITQKIDTLQRSTLGGLQSALRSFDRNGAPAPAPSAGRGTRAAPSGTALNPVEVHVQQPAATMFQIAERLLEPVLGPLGDAAIVVIVAIFILMQQDDLRDRLIRLFGSSDLHRTTVAMNDAARRLSKYFLTQLAINAGFGVIVTIGLSIIGIPSAPLWGVMAMLLRFVPYLGAPLAGALPTLLGAAVEPGWGAALSVIGLFGITELFLGQVVEPMAYGHSTGLSPVSIVVSALFWTWIWGPIGLLLSTPLTLCLVVLGRHVERLSFLDVILGDRPALTPVESLYQRLLANDPDEAASQAETLLRERPLSVYYDEVALRSLELAAADVARGVLSRERQFEMRDAIAGLVEDLDEHGDETPPPEAADDGPAPPTAAERAIPRTPALEHDAPDAADLPPTWQGSTAALCVGGRLPLDDAVAAMLAQLLRKHRFGARMASHEAAGRHAVHTLDREGIACVCICYLEATGSVAHLRSLVRRLRTRLPDAKLVLLLAPSGADVEPERDLRRVPGLDAVAENFRDTISVCLEWAERAAAAKVPESVAA